MAFGLLFLVLFPTFSSSVSPVMRDLLQSFIVKNMQTHNLQTYRKEKVLAGSKRESGVEFVIQAYGGPEIFSQIAVWCDQCSGIPFTDDQVRICDANMMQFYSHLMPDSRRSFATELKSARGGKHIFLDGDTKYKIRLSSGGLKCDGRGPGSRLRLDFFSR